MAEQKTKGRNKKKPRFPHVVCKPCWELKYCPYGPLVEFFPLRPEETSLKEIKSTYARWLKAIRSGALKTEKEIYSAIEGVLWARPGFWSWISQFRTEELGCSVFGHICPVFFSAESFTETKQYRNIGRTIPRGVMIKVVRRDGHACQACNKNVPDHEIEFDHIIPYSRGGPTSVENLRLLCRSCNRKKKAGLKDLLNDECSGSRSS